MLDITKQIIDEYYSGSISSQKLIAHLNKFENKDNETVYCEYHKTTNVCCFCEQKRTYTGFKHGYRCSKECCYKRKINNKSLEIINTNLILEHVTKQKHISRKFLNRYSITEKECYDLVFSSKTCNYCDNDAQFINWANGYNSICSSEKCAKTQRYERTKKTNLKKYGCENVSGNKEIQKKKLETFKNNFGVDNISQLQSIRVKIRKTMENIGRWVTLEERSGYSIYFKSASFKHGFRFSNLTTDDEKKLLNENGIYNNITNKNGIVRDHLLSRKFGYDNNIAAWIISHPANCEFVTHKENLRRAKFNDNLISLDELLERINKCKLT